MASLDAFLAQGAEFSSRALASSLNVGGRKQSAEDVFWRTFGCQYVSDNRYVLPSGVIALSAPDANAHSGLIDFMKTLGVVPGVAMLVDGCRQAMYRISDPELANSLVNLLPEGTVLIREGEPITLPQNWRVEEGRATRAAELAELTADDVARLTEPHIDPVLTSNPLLPFSLRGQSGKFRQMAIEATPLLGEVCLRGQVTIWYAAPGTGKTLIALSLILDAVREKRIAAGNVFYVNADDNGQGFATKLQIMDDIGGNTLAPGFKSFRAADLISLLHKMADENEARGALVIVDTIKKFASLMDKRESSEFAHACRRVAMMGGTVLGLAHTTKNKNSDGTPRYAGTSDLVDDADAAYVIEMLDSGRTPSEKMVQFRCFKARGDCAESATYGFAAERGVSYEEKLASVELIDPDQADEFQAIEAERADAEVLDALASCINEGINTKMLLIKEAASRANVSGRAAGRILQNYTGSDPSSHRWQFRRGDRGSQIYELLKRLPDSG